MSYARVLKCLYVELTSRAGKTAIHPLDMRLIVPVGDMGEWFRDWDVRHAFTDNLPVASGVFMGRHV